MGCHTWCFSHIPEKEQEWENELKETIVNGATEMLDHLKNNVSDDYYQRYVDVRKNDLKEFLERYESQVAAGDISECISWYGSEEALNKGIEELRNELETISVESIKKHAMDKETYQLEAFNSSEPVIDILTKLYNELGCIGSNHYGLYKIRDNKIYRDCTHFRGPSYGENSLFDQPFHNIFRIYDYEAKSCYSLEETLERCKEYNVDWDEVYKNSDVKINDLEMLHDFWKMYPDSIIEFG